MSDVYSGEKASQAVAAIKRLMPQHEKEHIKATPLGGCNAQAFKVDAGASSYFVRVLPEDGEWDEYNMATVSTCVANTRALGEVGVTAPVLADDEAAVIQAFMPGERMEYMNNWDDLSHNMQSDEAERIGAMIATIHAAPLPDPNGALAPHCHYQWDIKAERFAIAEPLVDCWNYIETRDAPRGVGGEIVLTHGDLHNKNVLVQANGSLLAVDLELSGLGHRAFDLAFFFFHWEWFGTSGYPGYAARRAIASSYLNAAKGSASDEDVSDLLWEIEYVILRIALLRTDHADTLKETRDMYMVQLPIACELLKAGASGDQDVRDAVIQRGLLPVSLSICSNVDGKSPVELLCSVSGKLPMEQMCAVKVH